MKRWLCVLLIMSLSGCSSEAFKTGWSASWSVVATPVLVVSTPYNAAWDLAFTGPERFQRHGLTPNMWRLWADSVRGRDSSWGTPLGIVLLPILTLVQPLAVFLHLAGQRQGG